MALNEVDPAANRSTANGATTVFPYTFEIASKNDIEVLVDLTVKTVDTDYTVDGIGNSGGGNVTFLTAPANNTVVTRLRKQPAVQASVYTANQGFPHAQVMNDFDKLWMAVQQVREQIHRALLLPKSSALVDQGMDVPTVGSFARGKVGGGIDWATVTSSGSITLPVPINEGGTGAITAGAARTALDVPSNAEAILDSIINAKGDLIVGTGNDTPSILPVGSNGRVAVADSTQSLGFQYRDIGVPQEFRLTLETGVPVSTTNQTGRTTLYATPYTGNRIGLYDGTSAWYAHASAEMSIAVPASTATVYDVFIYDNAGTPTLELTAWTNDTTRATALTRQNGILAKSGATTRRYLGTFRTTGVSGQTEDSTSKRYLWNYYFRASRNLLVTEATNSWNYTTATWRQANGAASNQVEVVIGVAEDPVLIDAHHHYGNTSGSVTAATGIGIDSTSVDSSQIRRGGATDAIAAGQAFPTARYRAALSVGYHYIAWLERSQATGTTTWYGDNGDVYVQSGLMMIISG